MSMLLTVAVILKFWYVIITVKRISALLIKLWQTRLVTFLSNITSPVFYPQKNPVEISNNILKPCTTLCFTSVCVHICLFLDVAASILNLFFLSPVLLALAHPFTSQMTLLSCFFAAYFIVYVFTWLLIALGENRRVSLPEPESFIPLSADISVGKRGRTVILYSQREVINIISPFTVNFWFPIFKTLIAHSLIPEVHLMS